MNTKATMPDTPGFTKGKSMAADARDATKRALPKGSYQGTMNRPLAKGSKQKFVNSVSNTHSIPASKTNHRG